MAIRKEVRERIEELKTIIFPQMIGKVVTVSFGQHTFDIVLHDICNKPVTGFKLAPDKRQNLDNKTYTPTLIQLVCSNDGDELVFTDEDTKWITLGAKKVKAKIGDGGMEVLFVLKD